MYALVALRGREGLHRASAFQEVYHSESTRLEKTPTAQLTRIDAADRLFSVPLRRINKCTGACRFVRGVLVGIGRRVAELWGLCGLARAPRLARPPDTGAHVLQPLGFART